MEAAFTNANYFSLIHKWFNETGHAFEAVKSWNSNRSSPQMTASLSPFRHPSSVYFSRALTHSYLLPPFDWETGFRFLSIDFIIMVILFTDSLFQCVCVRAAAAADVPVPTDEVSFRTQGSSSSRGRDARHIFISYSMMSIIFFLQIPLLTYPPLSFFPLPLISFYAPSSMGSFHLTVFSLGCTLSRFFQAQ